MTLTCYCCPAQIAIAGRADRMALVMAAFGWRPMRGGFCCSRCGSDE